MTLNPDKQEPPAQHSNKYQGIKMMGNSSTRNPTGRYIEEHSLHSSTRGGYVPMGSKTIGVMRERGYDTLREKKIIEKYPM